MMPACAAQPGCSRFVHAPPSRNAIEPAAVLSATPSAERSCAASRPSSRPGGDGRAEDADGARGVEAARVLPGGGGRHADAPHHLVAGNDRLGERVEVRVGCLGDGERGREHGGAGVRGRGLVRVVGFEGVRADPCKQRRVLLGRAQPARRGAGAGTTRDEATHASASTRRRGRPARWRRGPAAGSAPGSASLSSRRYEAAQSSSAAVAVRSVVVIAWSPGRLEATVGIEPTIRVLQTPALPLGYVAPDFDCRGCALRFPARRFQCCGSSARAPRFPGARRDVIAGAEDETRTHTPLRAPPPQDGVSANSTTSAGVSGRSGGVRTPDLRFWRPLLFQLSYTPAPHRV